MAVGHSISTNRKPKKLKLTEEHLKQKNLLVLKFLSRTLIQALQFPKESTNQSLQFPKESTNRYLQVPKESTNLFLQFPKESANQYLQLPTESTNLFLPFPKKPSPIFKSHWRQTIASLQITVLVTRWKFSKISFSIFKCLFICILKNNILYIVIRSINVHKMHADKIYCTILRVKFR